MIDSGASVNVFPKWFGESVLEKSDGSFKHRGADGRTLRDHVHRPFWLRNGSFLRHHDFHVLEVTKPIVSVSHRCENGIESHLARHHLLKSGERHEPLIRKSGVNFVRAQIAHEVKGTIESCVRAGGSQNSCVRVGRLLNSQKCGSSPCDDAIVQPVVGDPADDDIIPVEARSPHRVGLPSLRK